jgi:DNA end-binding protein Ku
MASTVWKGHLTFGLVSLPVRLYSAARGETVSFNLLHAKDNSRIKQVTFCQAEDQPVPRSELVKGYEYEKDHYVVIEEEDIKKVAPKTAKVMEILEFVKGDAVDAIYLESSYYMAPDGGGEKPYALLFAAMGQPNYYALAKIAMHNREHIVILRPGKKGILLHTMYYADEIRQVDEFRTDTDLVKPNELAMANMLIDTLKADFEPEKYHDTYRDNLMRHDRGQEGRAEGGGDAGAAHGAGDRHHGSAEAQPGGEEEAGAGGYGGGRRGGRREAPAQPVAKKRERGRRRCEAAERVPLSRSAPRLTFCRHECGIM